MHFEKDLIISCVYVCSGNQGDQKSIPDLLDPELQVVRSFLIWVMLGTKPQSSAMATRALNC